MAVDFKIFIDTNILLDLYRVRGKEAGLSILTHIDDHLDRFITTTQVEMEFKKNRQRVIVGSHGLFKPPNFEGLQLPVFVSEAKQSKALARHQKELRSHATKLRNRMSQILKNPTTHDPVYKTAQRLFRAESEYNLSREKKIRYTIRNLVAPSEWGAEFHRDLEPLFSREALQAAIVGDRRELPPMGGARYVGFVDPTVAATPKAPPPAAAPEPEVVGVRGLLGW
jgi:predicted nucleic acid-binding protein